MEDKMYALNERNVDAIVEELERRSEGHPPKPVPASLPSGRFYTSKRIMQT
jgi:hypothetical protein